MEVFSNPYPHTVLKNFSDFTAEQLNDNFPPLNIFGKTIRMDGDLSSHDPAFQEFLKSNEVYQKIINRLSSKQFIKSIIDAFNESIQFEIDRGELLHDPRELDIIEENLETRKGAPIREYESPKIFSRLDIGFAGLGYGIENGGKGIHTDNRRRLFSCLLYLNTPAGMVGGEHRLYSMSDNYKTTLEKSVPVQANLFVGSLQSNFALHDVNPITQIEGYRKAIYVGITCTNEIWKKIGNKKHAKLTQNRYFEGFIEKKWNKLKKLLS